MEQNLQIPLSTSTGQEIKFCKDCKHCVKGALGPQWWKCANTRVISFLDGTVTYNYCHDERVFAAGCGSIGRNFEAVPSYDSSTHAGGGHG